MEDPPTSRPDAMTGQQRTRTHPIHTCDPLGRSVVWAHARSWLLLFGPSTNPRSPPGGTKVWQIFRAGDQRGLCGLTRVLTGGSRRAKNTLTPGNSPQAGRAQGNANARDRRARRRGSTCVFDIRTKRAAKEHAPSGAGLRPLAFSYPADVVREEWTPRRLGRATAMRLKAAMVSVADASPNRPAARWSGRRGGLSANPARVLARSCGSPALKSRTQGSPVSRCESS